MNLSKVKLVVTDMDGTLLNSKGKVSDNFFKLYNQLQKQGVQFAAASGRQFQSISDKLHTIKNDISIIAENGGLAKYKNQHLVLNSLDIEKTMQLIPDLRKIKGTYIVLCGKKGAYIETQDHNFIKMFQEYYPKYFFLNDLLKVMTDEFFKIALYHYNNSEKYIYPSVQHLENEFQIKVSGEHWVDISHPNANKGYALKLLQDKLGITREETMVFGDYNNDLEMLELADFSYAMENAHPNVKKTARFQTKSNNNEGVELILEKLLTAKFNFQKQ